MKHRYKYSLKKLQKIAVCTTTMIMVVFMIVKYQACWLLVDACCINEGVF